jgi:5,10-methylene-tetrahydrofolate dehydrogenase/methenyl tetrahydrofolate cyclohydrolase
MTLLLDGKAASQALRSKLSIDLKKPPHVVFILVGNHPSSLSYVSIKKRTCEEVFIRSTICHLAEDISEKQLLMEISHLNSRDDVDGILVQLPLPQNLRVEKILEAIDPQKDVDCLHPYNLGRLWRYHRPSPLYTLRYPGTYAVLQSRSHPKRGLYCWQKFDRGTTTLFTFVPEIDN